MYTIDEKTHKDILTYLLELPAKYANPLINVLVDLQQKAQAKINEDK